MSTTIITFKQMTSFNVITYVSVVMDTSSIRSVSNAKLINIQKRNEMESYGRES